MVTMTPRERVMTAVSLKEPDRAPMDLGSHVNSSIHVVAYEALKRHLGVQGGDMPPLVSKMMLDVRVDEPVLQALHIDTRGVFAGLPDKGDPADLQGGEWVDEWGVKRIMPPGSHYYDLVLPAPLGGDITVADIARYPWPQPKDGGVA